MEASKSISICNFLLDGKLVGSASVSEATRFLKQNFFSTVASHNVNCSRVVADEILLSQANVCNFLRRLKQKIILYIASVVCFKIFAL